MVGGGDPFFLKFWVNRPIGDTNLTDAIKLLVKILLPTGRRLFNALAGGV